MNYFILNDNVIVVNDYSTLSMIKKTEHNM